MNKKESIKQKIMECEKIGTGLNLKITTGIEALRASTNLLYLKDCISDNVINPDDLEVKLPEGINFDDEYAKNLGGFILLCKQKGRQEQVLENLKATLENIK